MNRSPLLKNMRAGIDYVGVGVGAVIINKEGKYFLAQRGKKTRNQPGMWHFPGGTLEFNESPEVCIKREMFEEFGIKIRILDSLLTVSHTLPIEKQHWVAFCFIAEIAHGNPKIMERDKCSDIGWFTMKEIEKLPLASVSKIRIKQLKEKPHPRQ